MSKRPKVSLVPATQEYPCKVCGGTAHPCYSAGSQVLCANKSDHEAPPGHRYINKAPSGQSVFVIAPECEQRGHGFPTQYTPHLPRETHKVLEQQKRNLIDHIQSISLIDDPVTAWFAWQKLAEDSKKSIKTLKELAAAIKAAAEAQSLEEWAPTFKEFAQKPLVAEQWLLEGLLKLGRIALLAAESKTGKSLLHYDIAYAVATGDLWGEFPISRPYSVIVVQTDEPEVDCQERIKQRGLSELENGRVITKFRPQYLPKLRELMAQMGPGLLILDSLTSINRFSGYSPNDPEYAYFIYQLKDLTSEYGWTILLVHHTNKSPVEIGLDKLAGSYAIPAATSDIFIMFRPKDKPDGEIRLLQRTAGRSGGKKTWKLELNLEDYSYIWHGEVEANGSESAMAETDARGKATARRSILNFLQQEAPRPYETVEIAELLRLNSNRVRAICGELFKDGVIKRRASSHNKRAKCYYLPEIFSETSDHPITSCSSQACEKDTGRSKKAITPLDSALKSDQVDPKSDHLIEISDRPETEACNESKVDLIRRSRNFTEISSDGRKGDY